jgi:hypothetical protein
MSFGQKIKTLPLIEKIILHDPTIVHTPGEQLKLPRGL